MKKYSVFENEIFSYYEPMNKKVDKFLEILSWTLLGILGIFVLGYFSGLITF